MSSPTFKTSAWRDHGTAFGVALALHAGVAYLLINLSHTPELPAAPAPVIQTQLVQLPAPVPTPMAVPEPPAATPVTEKPAPPTPKVPTPVVDEAALALKRVQQQKREQQRQEQARQQREEAERREQQLARQEQARQQQAREAQARDAVAAQARAAAEAASRQYLPIAKEAPDYPQRALDRNIEGECTVAYTVTPDGRVSDPQVVGQCHPLFVKPSLAAAKRFRYQPRVVDGQAVAVANVKNTFTYRIR
ncbi:energy transducer TonB [Pseudomonas sp. NPDC089401]|uniref:energy transducer TonB n=1 Tax=Pseudomonas sp. NPDC089401 TaxID=3364462 RepID=UPI00382A6B81